MVLAAAGVALGGVAATLAYGVRAPSSQLFGPSIFRGPGQRRSIALTFDDGPSEGTLRLVDYLESRGIHATFFQCGMNVRRHPAITRRVLSGGHQIGNHTWSHPHLYLKSHRFIEREFTDAQSTLEQETGMRPLLLRAPYGVRWIGMRPVQKRLGLLGVMWTVIGMDWKWPADRIADYVLGKSAPGGIICLHDGRDIQVNPDISEMLTAVRKIVPILQDRGYHFETISELLRPDIVQ